MQCVEKGLFTLDEPAERLVPELSPLKIFEGFEGEGAAKKPILEAPKTKITLRMLLTHTAGLNYAGLQIDPAFDEYALGLPGPRDSVVQRFVRVLAYEPGSSWMYGVGVDVAGVMVARASKTSLEDYFKQHIFAPLGIKDLTFFPDRLGADFAKTRFMATALRDAKDGSLSHFTGAVPYEVSAEEFGGHGLCGTVEEYIKVLQSMLNPGKLLKKASLDEMFTPQLSEAAKGVYMYIQAIPGGPRWTFGLGMNEPQVKKTYGLGGALLEEEFKYRSRGTMVWSGMPNVHWWVDREKGLCGIFGTQVWPTDDDECGEMGKAFEIAVKDEWKAFKGKA